ncbi:E3 ubiquitin-protein ligase sina [Pseudolycoriella hygida]|uniref:E3 ubiquitin-protein ligase sina n=1 Tax=Pseudolycoriella hygida TaxID=35572 RepID=A0A9Q0S6G3_9DIPT|nr:E3 ubiquitin-protein ligase sina [Pseudolycoriella hygida]
MDYAKIIGSFLQCYVCYEDYKRGDAIWQCALGHAVCGNCRVNLHICPSCKSNYDGTRNLSIEEIVKQMPLKEEEVEQSTPDNKQVAIKLSPVKNIEVNVIEAPDSSDNNPEITNLMDAIRLLNNRSFLPQSVQRGYPWVQCSPGNIPPNAVKGGRCRSFQPLLIARAFHEGALLPGKVNFRYRKCFVSYRGREYEKNEFEVLCDVSGSWIPDSGGSVPPNAYPAGYTADYELLYIGRAQFGGTLTVGRVQTTHACCYISFDGVEHGRGMYEVFVLDA